MAFNVLVGPCEICARAADYAYGTRTCEACETDFDKLCMACSEGPCPHCGNAFARTGDVFPHSLFKAIEAGSVGDVGRILARCSTGLGRIHDKSGHHPLAVAARVADKEKAAALCALLIGVGISPHARTGEARRTTLTLMARYRVYHPKVADMLSASVNDADSGGQTALMFAVVGQSLFGQRRGNLGIAKHLVGMGADVGKADTGGRTALDHARKANDTDRNNDVIDYLESV
ncbi:ankyrin repeat domain-containing protein [Methylobacterium sp. WL69]|uniref:ankyrin repeat domain-containing protein n=1 Tax=Methylobacterium sp. WL69 TaxID=2603893 RepID=UPI0011CB95FC|nr:ankyrin repeat domain-containing protein [Methylobacterium sp. WL69]TXM73726.1 ankyrin repeat domain-containing protein [Methylobacterium sp. WL69]